MSDDRPSDPKIRASSPTMMRPSEPNLRASSPTVAELEPVETERSRQARGRTSGAFDRPITQLPLPAPGWQRPAQIALWIALALPALYQLGLLATAIAGRFSYPYDLEWMEGGMLHHAQRIRDGAGIYVEPSVNFIPYLYTPLYPSVLALLGGAFGVTYSVGRAISIAALLGIGITATLQIATPRHGHTRKGPPAVGVALGLGLFCAAYPISDGWYDLVRADTLFLLLVTVGIGALPRWCKLGTGFGGHAQVAASATILTLAFFCKQTGFVYVAFGGAIVLVLAWRRVGAYIFMSGLLGLGGTWLMQGATDGWFWTYISEIHRAHDFNMERFWKSFWFILVRTDGHPLLGLPITLVVVASLAFVGVTWRRKRVRVPQAQPLLLWSALFAVSVVVGAIGWGTEFAHFNAYIPAQLHGALAAGAAVPAVYACAKLWWGDRKRGEWIACGATSVIAIPLAITCITASWSPKRFIPTDRDVAAGDKLIERLGKIKGEVWMPSHPWYLVMAGHKPRVHRMGIKDVTARQSRTVAGLDDALSNKAFTAIVLDNVDIHNRDGLGVLNRNYRPALQLPENERPRVFTGARVVPDQVWMPAIPARPPANAKVLFDFEHVVWAGWERTGVAWGNGPVETAPSGQDIVEGVSGRRFGSSMHDGDKGTGRITTPAILLDATKLTVRIGGGTDTSKLRVELYIDDGRAPAWVTSVKEPGGDTLRLEEIPIPPDKRGKTGRLVFVDDSPTGHLEVDDVWAWQE